MAKFVTKVPWFVTLGIKLIKLPFLIFAMAPLTSIGLFFLIADPYGFRDPNGPHLHVPDKCYPWSTHCDYEALKKQHGIE